VGVRSKRRGSQRARLNSQRRAPGMQYPQLATSGMEPWMESCPRGKLRPRVGMRSKRRGSQRARLNSQRRAPGMQYPQLATLGARALQTKQMRLQRS
jgi:hypothetical protein